MGCFLTGDWSELECDFLITKDSGKQKTIRQLEDKRYAEGDKQGNCKYDIPATKMIVDVCLTEYWNI